MKAKLLSIVALMVLVLSFSQATEALTIPDVPIGVQFLASYDQENGTAYIVNENHPDFPGWNNLADGYDPDNLPAWASRIKPRGAMPQPGSTELEDTWGIFILGYIKDGVLVANTVNPLSGGMVHYSNQDNSNPKDTWLVGISWGGNDTAVTFDEPGTNEVSSFTVLTGNVRMELWAVEMADLDPTVDVCTLLSYNVSRRTAVNEYTGWLDAAIKANGKKLLSGTSTYVKFDGALMGSSYFSGDTFAWFDLDETDTTALWNAKWGSEPLLIDPGLKLADIYMNWGLQFSSEGWDTYSRDFGGVNVTEPNEPGESGCRVTGGGNDTFDEDGIGPFDDKLAQDAFADGSRYTFGGQAGSPTGCQPQPWGEWTHNHHSGLNASFTFHAGTASAPEGTEIDWITCSDPPCCLPARQAPTKQIDFGGVGTFKNVRVKNNSPLKWIVTDKLYEFAVHIEDLGEPGSTNTKKNPLLGTAACPPEGRNGMAGDWANCGCPDFYRITIFNPDGDDYVVYGYIDGGNLQIHPSHPCK